MKQHISYIAKLHENKRRIDQVLASRDTNYTRSFFAQLIHDGKILVNSITCTKAGHKVTVGDRITINFPEKTIFSGNKDVSSLAISVIFEHEHFLIINKPAGVVVHETQKRDNSEEVTVVDWLLHNYPELSAVGYAGRPGIVHRLDKDTSGIMVIPKTTFAHGYFAQLFKNRHIKKEYHALVVGTPPISGIIDFPIGRDQKYRTKMKAFASEQQQKLSVNIRSAKTTFKTKKYFDGYAYVILHPYTGRTHQIRVHCAAEGFPIISDAVYGKSSHLIARQALHAFSLSFTFQDQEYNFFAPIPLDMEQAVQKMTLKDSSL